MARGQTDFGEYAPTKTVAGMSDMGELAVRLGSINTYDRKGQVIWLEDFEDNINKWDITAAGAGGGATLSTATAKNGAKSCEIISGTVAGNETEIVRYVSRAVNSRIGLEVSFTSTADIGYQTFYIITDNGVQWIYGGIRYDPTLDVIQFLNSAGVWTTHIAAANIYQAAQCFNQLKFVIDLATGFYEKLLIGAEEIDLSDHALYYTAGIFFNFLGVKIVCSSRTTPTKATTYFDDVILTQNEP
jgi:hypothetical protein